MSAKAQPAARIALACGGTGGHLFPGMAVGDQLVRCGCSVTLLISPKEVDQQAVRSATGMQVATLPAVGLTRGRVLAFCSGFAQSYRKARKLFRPAPPQAVLAMGGFTSAPPLLAAKRLGARAYLHESNTLPGRANRWLSWVVDRAFVGFPSTARLLSRAQVTVTGTPVRPEIHPRDQAACRMAIGLDALAPVVLVMGGSQGASAINDLVVQTLPVLARSRPGWQWIHLAGKAEAEKTAAEYARLGLRAIVRPFAGEMASVLGAATAVVSRAGASSLAELAAMHLPAVLIPYPAATYDHQFHNARAFETSGAAKLLPQRHATADALAGLLMDLVENERTREFMCSALARWHAPHAAEEIAEAILCEVTEPAGASDPNGKAGKRPGAFTLSRTVPQPGVTS